MVKHHQFSNLDELPVRGKHARLIPSMYLVGSCLPFKESMISSFKLTKLLRSLVPVNADF